MNMVMCDLGLLGLQKKRVEGSIITQKGAAKMKRITSSPCLWSLGQEVLSLNCGKNNSSHTSGKNFLPILIAKMDIN